MTITRRITASRIAANCPKCGDEWSRHSTCSRTLRDLGTNQPVEIVVTYTKHFCKKCHRHFCVPAPGAAFGSRYTDRVKELAMSLVRKNGMTLTVACATLKNQYQVNVRPTTLHDWLSSTQEPQEQETTDAQETPSAARPAGGGGGSPPQEPQAPASGQHETPPGSGGGDAQ